MKIQIEQFKPLLGDVEKNLEKMVRAIDKAIENGKELVVFPELALTGNLLGDMAYDIAGELPQILLEKSKKISILFGTIGINSNEYISNIGYYLEDGDIIHSHKKVYLSNNRGLAEGKVFQSGEKFEVFDTKFGKFGILLGEDIFHQSAQYILANSGAKLIFSLVNSTIDTVSESVENLKFVARANSFLNGVFTVVVNRVGVEDGVTFYGNSFVVTPDGKIGIEGKFYQEESLEYEINLDEIRRIRGKNPISKDENVAILREYMTK